VAQPVTNDWHHLDGSPWKLGIRGIQMLASAAGWAASWKKPAVCAEAESARGSAQTDMLRQMRQTHPSGSDY